jgi:hypothetical protein
MTYPQARHAQAMALKIADKAMHLVGRMEGIRIDRTLSVPLEVVTRIFEEVPGLLEDIQSVLDDMLPELSEQ